jgi:hypothetical protein
MSCRDNADQTQIQDRRHRLICEDVAVAGWREDKIVFSTPIKAVTTPSTRKMGQTTFEGCALKIPAGEEEMKRDLLHRCSRFESEINETDGGVPATVGV